MDQLVYMYICVFVAYIFYAANAEVKKIDVCFGKHGAKKLGSEKQTEIALKKCTL